MRTPFRHIFAIADGIDITASSHEPVPPDPGGRPPRFPGDDVWPWLAALGVLAVAGLLVWIFVLRDNGNKGKIVPAVVGMQQQLAIAKLTSEGFNVNAIVAPGDKPTTQAQQVAVPDMSVGSIVRLSIAVGSNLPSTNVPNVVGQKASAARATLVGATLTVKTVYKKGKIGVVLAETPTGTAPAYTQITITVGN